MVRYTFRMEHVYFVTGNEKKASEVARLVPGVKRITLDLPEIQSLDAREVITAKLTEAHRQLPDKVLVVEDITYSIKGMAGLPGTLIKWFLNTVKPEGLYDLVKDKDRAITVCANLGIVRPDGSMDFVVGEVHGITVEPVGESGYYFDRILCRMATKNDIQR